MIIVHDLMLQLCLLTDFKSQVLQWDVASVPMKEPLGQLGQRDQNSCEMREVEMQTTEKVSQEKIMRSL